VQAQAFIRVPNRPANVTIVTQIRATTNHK
jgi:hypothetical protein